MHASGSFTVESFTPVEPPLPAGPQTAADVAVVMMEKRFTGEVDGRATTVFTYALDPATNVGGYVAVESFEGSLNGRTGAFNFSHSATTTGEDRSNESLTIIPSSGTGELAGISGTGRIGVESDGSHLLSLEYQLP